MTRQKLISTEELKEKFNEYMLEHPNANSVTDTEFAKFLKKTHPDIQHYTIGRDKEFKAYKNAYLTKIKEKIRAKAIVYTPLNVEKLFDTNKNLEALKSVLYQRDTYYHSIVIKASNLAKTNEILTQENYELKNELLKLNQVNDENIRLKECIITLKNIIEDNVYPAIATNILAKDGIIEVIESIIDDKKVEQNIIGSDIDLSMISPDIIETPDQKPANKAKAKPNSKYSSINNILKKLEDD